MSRSIVFRSLVLLTSSAALIVGCSAGTPTEGNLPPTKVATPADLENLQKKLEQEKVAGGAKYKAPPGVTIPTKPR